MGKTALVISGGGSKGAFAAGIVKRLSVEMPNLNFDILVGTSTGALIVPLVALEELDLLEEVYTTVTTEDIYTIGNIGVRLQSDNSIYDARPLARLITTHLDNARCQRLFSSPKELYIATTCLQTGRAVYFSVNETALVTDYEVIPLENADQLRRAVMASACQPVLMPPMEIKPGSVPIRQYVDGGVREYAGVQLAIDAGADEIYVILLSAGSGDKMEETFGDAFKILKRSLDIFIRDVGENDLLGPAIYNKALRYIDAVKRKMQDDGIPENDIKSYFDVRFDNPFAGKKPLKIHVIRPGQPLGGGPGGLEFNPHEMKNMLLAGELAITHYLATRPPDGSGNV